MLLVTMGTQPLQCERIINTIIDANLKTKVVIQSYYKNNQNKKIPSNITFFDFIPYDTMSKFYQDAQIVVTSGTGSIFRALNLNKKVIIFPRLGKYGEAADDHGLDMQILAEKGYAEFVEKEQDFKETYKRCKNKEYKKFKSNRSHFVDMLSNELTKL